VSERPFSQGDRPLVVAHRGDSSHEAENSLPAFEAAILAGADAIELDVRVTADGLAVVMHDASVDRTTDGRGLVRDLSAEQVRALRMPLRGGGAAGVPTLEEALRAVAGRAAVDIEIKNVPGDPDFEPDRQRAVDATLAVLGSIDVDARVMLSSFNPLALAHCRARAPELETGLLTDTDVGAEASLAFAEREGHPWVLPFIDRVADAQPGFAGDVHRTGLRLGVWVTDDPARAADLFRAGVDAVATNDPAAIVAARREALGV